MLSLENPFLNLNDSNDVIECVEQGPDGLFLILKCHGATAVNHDSDQETVSAMMAIADTSSYSLRSKYSTSDILESFAKPRYEMESPEKGEIALN